MFIYFFNNFKLNDLVFDDFIFALSHRQIKILFSLNSIIHDLSDLMFNRPIEITGRDIIKKFYYNNNYDNLRNDLKELSLIKINDNYIFNSIEYIPERSIICFRVSSWYKKVVKDISKGYVNVGLNNIVRLRKNHSVIFYMIFKRYQKLGKKSFTLEDLKKISRIKNTCKWDYFLNNKLKRFIADINQKTDIFVEYVYIRENKKITGIKFNIKKNKTVIDLNKQVEKIYKLAWKNNSVNVDINKIVDFIDMFGYEEVYKKTVAFKYNRIDCTENQFYQNQFLSM